MAKKLFVGNMPFTMTEDQMRDMFTKYGAIEALELKLDKFTGRSRGFGFVTFTSEDDANKAIEELNGFEVEYTMNRDGSEETAKRPLVVNESRPQEDRPRNSYNNRGNGGGYNNRRSGGYNNGGGYGGGSRYDDNGFENAA